MAAIHWWGKSVELPAHSTPVSNPTPSSELATPTTGASTSANNTMRAVAIGRDRAVLSFGTTDFTTYPNGNGLRIYDLFAGQVLNTHSPASGPLARWITITDKFIYDTPDVYDARTGAYLYTLPITIPAKVVGDVAIGIDSDGATQIVRKFDARTGRVLGEYDTGLTSIIRNIAMSSGKIVVTAGGDTKALVIDATTMTLDRTVTVGTQRSTQYGISESAVVAWKNLAAVASESGNKITVFNLLTGAIVRTITMTGPRALDVVNGVGVILSYAGSGTTYYINTVNLETGGTPKSIQLASVTFTMISAYGQHALVAPPNLYWASPYELDVGGLAVVSKWDGTTETAMSSISVTA